MRTIINYIKKLFDYAPTPFDDYANADVRPPEYDAFFHRAVAIIKASLIGVQRDALFTDTSRWQLGIDYRKMAAAGAKGTILKLGQGLGVDPYFKENWQKAKEAGLKRGTYFYYDSRVPPKTQARLWADTLKEVGFGELPHFVDYEESYGSEYRGIVNMQEFMIEFLRLTGLPDSRVGIYTGFFYWQINGSNDPFFTRFWLWLAWYGQELDVVVPNPWKQDKLFGWQYTSSGDGGLFGVSSKEIDLNFFVKGLAVFEGLYGETVDVEPSTGEAGMFRVWSTQYNMSLRGTATINGTFLERVNIGTSMVCDRVNVPPVSGGLPGDLWAHVVSVNGVQKDAWVAQVHNGVRYCQVENMSETNPKVTVIFVDEMGQVFQAENVELIRL